MGDGAHLLARAGILGGLVLGDAQRVGDDLAIAELTEGDGGAQHAVHGVVAARAQ